LIYAAVVANAPVSLQQVPGTNSQTSITMQWTAAYNGGTPITGYQVWWNLEGTGPVV
jgi:hypothetical protein